jgi:hypothetical protein
MALDAGKRKALKHVRKVVDITGIYELLEKQP